jgi:hypothetical protein
MKPRISGLLAIPAFVVACPLSNGQTLAQIPPVETALYSFAGGSDGGDPLAGLLADRRGALYGTTKGANPDCIDNGALYSTTEGWHGFQIGPAGPRLRQRPRSWGRAIILTHGSRAGWWR